MIPAVGISVVTSKAVKGPKWAERYPAKAADLWVRGHHNGKRVRIYIGPPTPENQARAEQKRAQLLAAVEILSGSRALVAPRFADAASEYLRLGMDLHGLAPTTQEDRRFMLAPEGPLVSELGDLRLDAIRPERLLVWWESWIVERGRTRKTGRNYLDAIAGVYGYAADRGFDTPNPVDAVRAMLRRRNRTKAARAEALPSPTPIESDKDVARFVEVSLEWAEIAPRRRLLTKHEKIMLGDVAVANMLMLDAGLRLGEAMALRWGHICWGQGADDTSRHLFIQEALARGRHGGEPKSGRARKVALSRRLRTLLRDRWLELGQPGDDVRVLVRRDTHKYRDSHFRKVCEKAQLGRRAPKDLRDTYASHLLTAGVPLGYIAKQLGHADAQVTARHYARWVDEEGYRNPLQVQPGEVPADLLSWLDSGRATKTPPHATRPKPHRRK